jgi:hypothetical protein
MPLNINVRESMGYKALSGDSYAINQWRQTLYSGESSFIACGNL